MNGFEVKDENDNRKVIQVRPLRQDKTVNGVVLIPLFMIGKAYL